MSGLRPYIFWNDSRRALYLAGLKRVHFTLLLPSISDCLIVLLVCDIVISAAWPRFSCS